MNKVYLRLKQAGMLCLLAMGMAGTAAAQCVPQWSWTPYGCSASDDINTFTLIGANSTSFNDVNTGCSVGAYDIRTAQTPVQMLQGGTYSGTVSSNYGSSENVRFWIDFDNDNTFAATEVVGTLTGATSGGSPYSITIPATAATGNHRMRVRLVYATAAASIDPCASYTFGEVHDYTVSILSPCAGPTGVTASGITATSANISWTAATPSTGYQYVLSTSSTPPTGAGTPVSGTSYNATGLSPATTYYFFVRNLCSSTVYSSWVMYSFSTPASCVAPATPTVSGITQTGANISWPAVGTSVGYEYVLNTTSTPPTGAGTPISGTSYSPSGLSSGTQYYFHVRNLCGGSLNSLWTTVSFTTLYPPCIQPSTPTVSNINVNGATLTWNAVATSSGYQWVVTTSATPPASGTATSNTTVNATGLTGSTLYYVFVRNNCGPGGFSPWSSTTFTTSSSCNMPSNVTVTSISATNALVAWDPIPGAANFEYIMDNSPQPPAVAGAVITGNKYAPGSLVSGTRYYFHLRTNCGAGAGYSSWVTVQFTTDTVCFAPVAVIKNINGTSADIVWQPEANAQNYQYLVSTNIVPPYSGYATTATAYKAKGLQKNTQYYMHLRSYCGGNDISAWRSTGFVTTEQATSVAINGNKDASVDIYPNPVSNILTIQVNGFDANNIHGHLLITDITGKVVKQQSVTTDKTQVDMQGIANGVYLLKYSDGDYVNILRLIKQ